MKSLQHPNIVKCLDVFEPNDIDSEAYVVMEMMKKSLYDHVIETGIPSEALVKRIFKKIVDGVDHCHGKGVIHHDLKLDNILVSVDARNRIENVKLTDFGLHRMTTDQLVGGVNVKGTIQYLAPEMLKFGTKYDKKIDTWSLGVILAELLTGVSPFLSQTNDDAQTMQNIVSKQVNFESSKWGGTSFLAQDMVDQLLQKKPSMRLSTGEIKAHPWL